MNIMVFVWSHHNVVNDLEYQNSSKKCDQKDHMQFMLKLSRKYCKIEYTLQHLGAAPPRPPALVLSPA